MKNEHEAYGPVKGALQYTSFLILAVFIVQQRLMINGHDLFSAGQAGRLIAVIILCPAACWILFRICFRVFRQRLSQRESEYCISVLQYTSILFVCTVLLAGHTEAWAKAGPALYVILMVLWFVSPFIFSPQIFSRFVNAHPFFDIEKKERIQPLDRQRLFCPEDGVFKKAFSPAVVMILMVSLAYSLAAAFFNGASNTDLNLYYIHWGRTIINWGPGELYNQSNCDYVPVYNYFLWASAAFEKLFDLKTMHSRGLVYKLFPVLSQYAAYFLVVLIVSRSEIKLTARHYISLSVITALNPVFIYIAAFWGQSDTVLLCFFLLSFLGMIANRLTLALTAAALGVLLKPTMVFLLPLLAAYAYYTFPINRIFRSTLAAGFVSGLCVAPFLYKMEAGWLARFYVDTASEITFTTCFAGTLPGFLSFTHQNDLEPAMFGLTYAELTMICLAGLIGFIFATYQDFMKRGKGIEPLLLLAAFSVYATYYLSTRMTARFIAYGLIFIIIYSFLYVKNRLHRFLLGWGLILAASWQVITGFNVRLYHGFTGMDIYRYIPLPVSFYLECVYQCVVFLLLCIIVYHFLKREIERK